MQTIESMTSPTSHHHHFLRGLVVGSSLAFVFFFFFLIPHDPPVHCASSSNSQLLLRNRDDVRKMTAMSPDAHYDAAYWRYQRPLGEFGGVTKQYMFRDHIRSNDTVVDFGSGGGFLLKHMRCGTKRGVDINPHARAFALKENGIRSVATLAELDVVPDVIISTSVLEHVECPLQMVRDMYQALRPGGKVIITLRNEGVRYTEPYKEQGDPDMHLYTWHMRTLGNMLKVAGFKVDSVTTEFTAWPFVSLDRFRAVGEERFLEACRVTGAQTNTITIVGVGHRPDQA